MMIEGGGHRKRRSRLSTVIIGKSGPLADVKNITATSCEVSRVITVLNGS
jgi:hypothetical protein